MNLVELEGNKLERERVDNIFEEGGEDDIS